MKKIHVAFDIDGTLRKNSEERHRTEIEVNEDVLDTLRFFAKCKNVELHLWSNRGAEYCLEIRQYFGLQKYIKEKNCHKKVWHKQWCDAQMQGVQMFVPDIAFDDQQRFDGAISNVIVREK